MFAMTVVVFDSTKKDISISANAKHTVQVAPKAFKVDNGSSQYIYANKVNAAYPMFLFGNNRKGKFSEGVAMKLYSFKVYENDVLIADYIPCKQGNAVGLYDDVAGAMNLPLGAGDFTAGPSISGTHKTLINGTVYTVKGGKCMVNGTVYSIKKGRTLIDGTGWDITFPAPLVMPVKGDLITMNLDGTDRLYRVLKIVDGTTVEVLSMGGVSLQYFSYQGDGKYADSKLDSFLDSTYYESLSARGKAAIVLKDVIQDQWTDGSSGSPTYTGTNSNPNDNHVYTISRVLSGNKTVGKRRVYALSIQSIIDYLSDKSVLAYPREMLVPANIWNAFFGRSEAVNEQVWLMTGNPNSRYAWVLSGLYGYMYDSIADSQNSVRPVFQIDLSKIDFTIN